MPKAINISYNCKDSLREDPKQWVDFSLASEKEYINTHNNQELRNNLHCNIKEKAFNITEETKVVTKTPNHTVLEFCCAIYTQNQSNLGLPEGCCPAESALTYYINAKINYYIGKEEEPHDTKLGLYRDLSQYTTKKVAVIATIIQYANENFLISTGNTREHTNKTKENLETNQESNQQKLGTLAQTPKKTPKFETGFENHEEESELESEKETSKKTITRLVTETSSQFRNQETRDQEEELDIKEAIFKNVQGNIIPPSLRPINPLAENGNKMATSYIARLTNFSEEEEETDIYTWLREAQSTCDIKVWKQNPQASPNLKMHSWSILVSVKLLPNTLLDSIEFAVLNQFIRELKSSILGRVHPAYPNSLPEAITLAKALELAEKEANHSQMVNMIMEENKTETLKKRVMQLEEELSKKIESYFILDPRRNTYQPPQKCSQEVSNSRNNCSSCQKFRTETCTCHFCKCIGHLIKTSTCQYHTNIPLCIKIKKLTNNTPKSAHVKPECVGSEESKLCWNQNNDNRNINKTKNSSNKLSQTILPAVTTENSSLAAIFPFKLEENETMFSRAALDKKRPITAIYTEATVNNTPIKLILDNESTKSIVMLQLVNQLGFKVDRAAIIVIFTKVLVMDTTQYQALVGNNWLTKANTTLDWTTQELLINYNGHQARIPATSSTKDLPSNLRKIQHYQPLKPINSFGLMTKEQDYQLPKLECSVCKKKLLSIIACSTPDKDPRNLTHYYCNYCNKEKYSYPERHGKWNEKPCFTCGELLPRGCRGETCNTTCQCTILIYNWVREGTPFEADELYNTAQTKSAEVANEVTSYNMFDPSKNNTSPKSTFTFVKTILSHAKISAVKSSQNQSINQQDLPDGPESEKFVAYTDLEQIIDIQYFDNGHLGIIPKRVHPTDTGFDLHYLEDKSTTLPPRSITKINLKIVVEILPGIIIQIVSQSSLAKKGISVQRGVIDSEYTGNLMVLLQNNSEKPYTIESKEKIAQTIFLLLVKIGKFVPVKNREELLQTTRRTFDFGLTEKGIEANFAETIEEKGKIKIPITNTTKEPVCIPKDTIIGYLETELENASTPQKILNFPEITLYCELTSINWQQPLEYYQFMPEKLAKLNIETMDPDQQRTNLVQHQIPTGDARPEKQRAYYIPLMEHNFIREKSKACWKKE
ncbi:hypothetical protein G9A89_004608 [Geosiphon pyriformis]|nr:hypothetical protein G9A89_004608 [Geosiphon pyriformis]